MSEETPQSKHGEEFAPAAEVHAKRGFSIVWVVPLVALVIGGWLAYKALSEKGPTITITFESAESLEAGKTKIKFKDFEIGVVTDINISKDLESVIATAELHPRAKGHLTENTLFWKVSPRISLTVPSHTGHVRSASGSA